MYKIQRYYDLGKRPRKLYETKGMYDRYWKYHQKNFLGHWACGSKSGMVGYRRENDEWVVDRAEGLVPDEFITT